MAEMVSKIQKERPSASADATLRAEVERVTAMTVEERIREALSMGSQFPVFPMEPSNRKVDEQR